MFKYGEKWRNVSKRQVLARKVSTVKTRRGSRTLQGKLGAFLGLQLDPQSAKFHWRMFSIFQTSVSDARGLFHENVLVRKMKQVKSKCRFCGLHACGLCSKMVEEFNWIFVVFRTPPRKRQKKCQIRMSKKSCGHQRLLVSTQGLPAICTGPTPPPPKIMEPALFLGALPQVGKDTCRQKSSFCGGLKSLVPLTHTQRDKASVRHVRTRDQVKWSPLTVRWPPTCSDARGDSRYENTRMVRFCCFLTNCLLLYIWVKPQ